MTGIPELEQQLRRWIEAAEAAHEEITTLKADLAQARKDIEIKDAQIAVISEMYDRVHTERDELLRQIGERGENPNYVEGRNFDKATEDHLTEASDKRRDEIDRESAE